MTAGGGAPLMKAQPTDRPPLRCGGNIKVVAFVSSGCPSKLENDGGDGNDRNDGVTYGY